MIILAISTSSPQGIVALQTQSDEIKSLYNTEQLEHNHFILPAVDQLLKESGLQLKDVDYFAASVGPGSFVGTRLAVAVVQGLAFGANKPVVAVSHLALMATALKTEEVILDAKMRGYYRYYHGQETFHRFSDIPPVFSPIPHFTGEQLIALTKIKITQKQILQDPSQLQPVYLHDEGNWKKL